VQAVIKPGKPPSWGLKVDAQSACYTNALTLAGPCEQSMRWNIKKIITATGPQSVKRPTPCEVRGATIRIHLSSDMWHAGNYE
jgi:hypothetical protein